MRKVRLAAIVLAAMVVVSCKGKGDKPEAEILSVNPATLSLLPNSSGTIDITSNVAWTVTAPAGFAVSPASGSKNGTIKVTAGPSPVSGFLKVQGKAKSATVSLSAAEADLALSESGGTVTYEAGKTVSFQVICNGDWSITLPSPKPDWLTGVSPMSGSKDATVTVTTGLNGGKTKLQTFLTVKCGKKTVYYTVSKEPAPNIAPTKPSNLKPAGSNVETITTFSWNASTDQNGDKITYTVLLSKDNSNWTSVGTTEKTSLMNTKELEKNTKYYYKVVADDGYEDGKTESDVISFTTGNSKSVWADGEVKQYNVNPDGSITEVPLGSTPRGVKLIYTGDGYTQDLFNYGGQFDKEVDAGIKALFEYEPYKSYTEYFTVYKVAAYSNEAGISVRNDTKVDTRFKCTWEGDGSTGIDCDADIVVEYAEKCPGIKGRTDDETWINLSWSPVSIIINAEVYAGTNIWIGVGGGMNMISIAQTPAREAGGGFGNTLRHEYGGHGFGLLDDEYVYYYTQALPHDEEDDYRYWQSAGALCNTYLPGWNSTENNWYSDEEHCNLSLTPNVEGANWNTFASRDDYAPAQIKLFSGSSYYGKGIYRSEYTSCMVDNIPHYNTISRWKIYCRIKITAGETPSLEEFMSKDTDRANTYASGAPATKSGTRMKCKGPLLKKSRHSKPYRLRR